MRGLQIEIRRKKQHNMPLNYEQMVTQQNWTRMLTYRRNRRQPQHFTGGNAYWNLRWGHGRIGPLDPHCADKLLLQIYTHLIVPPEKNSGEGLQPLSTPLRDRTKILICWKIGTVWKRFKINSLLIIIKARLLKEADRVDSTQWQKLIVELECS